MGFKILKIEVHFSYIYMNFDVFAADSTAVDVAPSVRRALNGLRQDCTILVVNINDKFIFVAVKFDYQSLALPDCFFRRFY